ncbi:unnamed protein product [Cylindrotheca closterium]|uniref:Uncharacterized protein n=1 Tax=Cylindrotheca closterium TaxID=2856 RepID=A0AAD2G372_9STRA|nr:unnamed protein product [Cylindrotheca closterium]
MIKEAIEELPSFWCGFDSRMATIVGNGLLFISILLLLLLVGMEMILHPSFYVTFSTTDRMSVFIIISVLTAQLFIYGMAIMGAFYYRPSMVKVSLELLTLGVTVEIGFGLLHLISRFNPIPLFICTLKAYILWIPMTAFINECDGMKNRNDDSELLFPFKHHLGNDDDDGDEEDETFPDHIRRRTASQ